jgi:hypothetical protein
MPATLIRYNDGSADLHCQSGDHYSQCVHQARVKLESQGYDVGRHEHFIGPSGHYYEITRQPQADVPSTPPAESPPENPPC